jgi:hypothetical protein
MDEHAGGALHERFDDKGGDVVGVGGELALELGEGRAAVRAGGGGDGNAAYEQRTEDAVKEIDAANGDRTEGVAVIGLAESEEPLLAAATAQLAR